MIINIKTRTKKGKETFFKEKILAGFFPEMYGRFLPKIHAFRQYARWKEGMNIQFETDVGTKNTSRFFETKCIGVQLVEIGIDTDHAFFIEIREGDFLNPVKRRLSKKELLLFAANDGFNNLNSMSLWYFPKGRSYAYRSIFGQIVHWTDFLY